MGLVAIRLATPTLHRPFPPMALVWGSLRLRLTSLPSAFFSLSPLPSALRFLLWSAFVIQAVGFLFCRLWSVMRVKEHPFVFDLWPAGLGV